jgi:hypothetical protein
VQIKKNGIVAKKYVPLPLDNQKKKKDVRTD